MKLYLNSVDSGFCRIYYRNDNRDLYCFQTTFGPQFGLYPCTTSGEPVHQVGLASRTLDRLPEATCKLTKDFAAFVAANEVELCLSK